jgi:hypothetical protein
MVNGSESTLPVYLVKCMIAVFSASKVAPLRLSQSSALSIIACISSPVALGRRSRYPRSVVIDKCNGPTIFIDLGLH